METKSESIGRATMSEDGTITLDLRAEAESGQVGTSRLVYPPSHAQYDYILKHLGGMKPKESKPVPPFETEKKP